MLFGLIRPLLLAILVLMLAACGDSASDKVAVPGSNSESGLKTAIVSIFPTEMPGWAKKYGCSSCHTIDKKLVGPAWMEIARKYKGDGGAAARLSDKITRGGGGVWGAMPMPPNTKVSDAEKKEMVDFILGLAK